MPSVLQQSEGQMAYFQSFILALSLFLFQIQMVDSGEVEFFLIYSVCHNGKIFIWHVHDIVSDENLIFKSHRAIYTLCQYNLDLLVALTILTFLIFLPWKKTVSFWHYESKHAYRQKPLIFSFMQLNQAAGNGSADMQAQRLACTPTGNMGQQLTLFPELFMK